MRLVIDPGGLCEMHHIEKIVTKEGEVNAIYTLLDVDATHDSSSITSTDRSCMQLQHKLSLSLSLSVHQTFQSSIYIACRDICIALSMAF